MHICVSFSSFSSNTISFPSPKLYKILNWPEGRLQSPNLSSGQLSTCCISPASLLLSQCQIEYRKFPKYWFGFVELKMYVPVPFARHFQKQGKYKEEKGGRWGAQCSSIAITCQKTRSLFVCFLYKKTPLYQN